MKNHDHPQHVLAVVARLHQKGFGLLKLVCYTKEGLGSWRYLMFAGTEFPDCRLHANIPNPVVKGSFPDWKEIDDCDVESAASSFVERHPDLMKCSIGDDETYTTWFSCVAAQAHGARLQMERSDLARLGQLRIYTPYQSGCKDCDG